MRYDDQVNLRWEKVDFQRNLIYVPNAKTGHEHGAPMNQDARRELQALKKGGGPERACLHQFAEGRKSSSPLQRFTPEMQQSLDPGAGTLDLSQQRALSPCTPGLT